MTDALLGPDILGEKGLQRPALRLRGKALERYPAFRPAGFDEPVGQESPLYLDSLPEHQPQEDLGAVGRLHGHLHGRGLRLGPQCHRHERKGKDEQRP